MPNNFFKQMKYFFKAILALALLVIASCSPKTYKDKAFFSKAQQGTQTLAILPVEVIFTGNRPKKWSLDQVVKMELEESLQFQESIYNDFLFQSKTEVHNKWGVKLMDYRYVNNLLEENGITIRDSWKLSSTELAEILGVDMLIRARVQNERIMSKGAAMGINIGMSVIRDVFSPSGSSLEVMNVMANENDMSLSLYHSSKMEAIARIADHRKLKIRKLPVYNRDE